MGMESLLLNTFHNLPGDQNRTVDKVLFSPQIFPSYPLTAGPNRAQTGFRKGLKTNRLRTLLNLSPQTFFDYNTKTNYLFLDN